MGGDDRLLDFLLGRKGVRVGYGRFTYEERRLNGRVLLVERRDERGFASLDERLYAEESFLPLASGSRSGVRGSRIGRSGGGGAGGSRTRRGGAGRRGARARGSGRGRAGRSGSGGNGSRRSRGARFVGVRSQGSGETDGYGECRSQNEFFRIHISYGEKIKVSRDCRSHLSGRNGFVVKNR